ncbi:membrane protein [Pseudonocardia dioxanivorans CB1190]|uniref:Membrane protein n=1 Tax=Pseudonocardia dioxanivorans (strain ATCC 55486 / DSM 44775 / JCM 13855 / CB1190) TaxID=675635 RepID=F4CZC5_PSEUX|nr:hypothetical protein [Pseudonocardia dioxanivorans]AEA25656.1 membrane protein [Pseudonocardia dioxanivorans CB1190]
MTLLDRAWQVPLRLAAGTYILDSGLRKWGASEEAAKHLQEFATGAYPLLAGVEPATFAKALSVSEVLIGTGLLIPSVPARVAGLGLVGFGAGLLGLYARTPGMRRPGTPFPAEEGIALAKDAWLAAIGAALVLGDRRRR